MLEETNPKERIQILRIGDFSSLSADRWSVAIDVFAAALGISPRDIRVYRVHEDSKEKRITRPTVFVSYSHADEEEKNELLSHLGVLEGAGLIDLWSDARIGAGADWETEISQAITKAKVAILLISANFLTPKFVLQKEVPELLNRRNREGLTIFPVIAKACAWKTVDWLAKMNVKPRNGNPVWSDEGSYVDKDLAAIAEEVAAIVRSRKG